MYPGRQQSARLESDPVTSEFPLRDQNVRIGVVRTEHAVGTARPDKVYCQKKRDRKAQD